MYQLKTFLEKLFPVPARIWKSARILRDLGQWRSVHQCVPVDALGDPIPWYTYTCLEYLRQFDFKQSRIFEFGTGNSTSFWAERAATVVSVEDDSEWFRRVESIRKPNLSLYLRTTKDSYVSCLAEQGLKFDVIVIDGKWRFECASVACEYLADGGMIVFDNTDWHRAAIQLLRERGFFEIDFSGIGPVNRYAWTTSIFIQANARMQQGMANPCPVGGIVQDADERTFNG
jgi:hypothetical protein